MSDIIQIENLEGIEQVRKAITDKHKQVSNIKTPKPFIKKKMGMEYVEYSYMREIADKEFPGWSWKVVSTEVLGSEAYVVHGRLKFYDEGIWRECDVTASHRIQKQRGTNDFVDIGEYIEENGVFNLYDLKTTAAYKWSTMFGIKKNKQPVFEFDKYRMQLATYGLSLIHI